MRYSGRAIALCCGVLSGLPSTAVRAQDHGAYGSRHPAKTQAVRDAGTPTLGNVSEKVDWPEPVADEMTFWLVLFELLEYQTSDDGGEVTWDLVGWFGGDYNRFWFKTEGTQEVTSAHGELDVQALYGRLITPFFDLQAGLRYNQVHGGDELPWRVSAALGVQGISPLRFEIEPVLFVSHKGEVSGRLTLNRSVLLTQNAALQGRFETEATVQKVEELGVGSGLNNITLGLRLRYDLRRELSPYIGVSWTRSLFGTADLARAAGVPVGRLSFVAGLRVWL